MDAISTRYSVIDKSLTWSRDVLLALRVVRVPLVVSVAAAVFLCFVPQIIEIYNILVEQIIHFAVAQKDTLLVVLLQTALLVLLSMLPFVLMSFVDLVRNAPSGRRVPEQHDESMGRAGPYDVVLEWAPGSLATLPLFAVAYGMYAAPRSASMRKS